MEGVVTLKKQDIEEDIIIDSLTINLVGSSIKEKINEVNTAVKFAINLDSDPKIIFTVNSYYTSIVNEKTDGTNLINPLTSPREGVTVFTSPYLSAGAPALGQPKGLMELINGLILREKK